ncbi:MAG: hypothetical protein AABY15_03485 [Nanoarchaeota archaeon]
MKIGKRLKDYKRKTKPKAKKFMNIMVGLAIFIILIGTAFKMSFLFGMFFIVGFALSIYNGDLKNKPWKPIAIFIGALIVGIALNQFFEPVLSAKTLMDLAVSLLIFLSIIIFGWKIKKS